jgi:hypothetical protein
MKYGAFQSLVDAAWRLVSEVATSFRATSSLGLAENGSFRARVVSLLFTPKLEVLTPRTLHDFGMFLDVTF